MISGFVQHNNYKLALQCFKNMQQKGLKPDAVTFVCVLSACCHLGLRNEGCHHFKLMIDHGIVPVHEHYNCMVDLLGRTGYLTDAKDLLQTMPFQPNAGAWMSLLSHCRTHGNLELGRLSFQNVMAVDGRDSTGYVLMTNIYAHADMAKDAHEVQELRMFSNALKWPGKALIEVHNEVHDFVVGDTSHPQSVNIYEKMRKLFGRMKDEGYMPHLLDFFSNKVEVDILSGH